MTTHAATAVVLGVLVACAVYFAVRAASPFAPRSSEARDDRYRAFAAALCAGAATTLAYL